MKCESMRRLSLPLKKNSGALVVVLNESHDRGKERLRLHFSSIQ
jgi:hypothetical protein